MNPLTRQLINTDFLIIGAGPTGLGAAYQLEQLHQTNYLIIEQNSFAGGLSATLTDKYGFIWDIGGHVLYSQSDIFNSFYEKTMSGRYLKHLRNSHVIYDKDTMTPFPAQLNLHRLKPGKLVDQILQELLTDKLHQIEPTNFSDWLINNYGPTLCLAFMFPYNYKVWATPAQMMDYKWINQRVAPINKDELLTNTKQKIDHRSWGPNSMFKFPENGGNGYLWQTYAGQLGDRILYNTQLQSIHAAQKMVMTKNNLRIKYRHLISTIPLDRCVKSLTRPPLKVKKAAQSLRYSSIIVTGIALHQPIPSFLKDKCWIYFPSDNTPVYRITIFSNYSENNVPDQKKYWSILAETSTSYYKPVDEAKLPRNIVKSLIKLGLIPSAKSVHHTHQFKARYGYPTPTLNRDSLLQIIQPYLEKHHIFSRGRFGSWKYELGNQDHGFLQGVEVIKSLFSESTPDI